MQFFSLQTYLSQQWNILAFLYKKRNIKMMSVDYACTHSSVKFLSVVKRINKYMREPTLPILCEKLNE